MKKPPQLAIIRLRIPRGGARMRMSRVGILPSPMTSLFKNLPMPLTPFWKCFILVTLETKGVMIAVIIFIIAVNTANFWRTQTSRDNLAHKRISVLTTFWNNSSNKLIWFVLPSYCISRRSWRTGTISQANWPKRIGDNNIAQWFNIQRRLVIL